MSDHRPSTHIFPSPSFWILNPVILWSHSYLYAIGSTTFLLSTLTLCPQFLLYPAMVLHYNHPRLIPAHMPYQCHLSIFSAPVPKQLTQAGEKHTAMMPGPLWNLSRLLGISTTFISRGHAPTSKESIPYLHSPQSSKTSFLPVDVLFLFPWEIRRKLPPLATPECTSIHILVSSALPSVPNHRWSSLPPMPRPLTYPTTLQFSWVTNSSLSTRLFLLAYAF